MLTNEGLTIRDKPELQSVTRIQPNQSHELKFSAEKRRKLIGGVSEDESDLIDGHRNTI
jgi:hypothetical protein